MTQHPRGVWIWKLSEIRPDYLDKLVERKVKRVYLKVFDGQYQGQPTFWAWQCSPEIVKEFKDRGIEVYGWGYHYGTPDTAREVVKVRQALNCGLDGYVVDVEKEVENTRTHTNIDKLLFELRLIVKQGTFGYTSFGNPRLHPNVPWKILDKYCDIAFPQIYFEKFTFKPTTPEEVKDCLDAYKNLGLKKLILPVWGSESDTAKPASAAELQDYLSYYPGSSIWRIPNESDRSQAWNLVYSDFVLPTLRRNLRQGLSGEDVKVLQKVLNARGYNAGKVDGIFGPQTETAVRGFQKEAGLTIDGIVGVNTWTALGGKFDASR
ncbi:MAG: peptidoglycan-binding domain-containing protein [Scytonema sp. PMC 1069.18]|nr:peptidoglycan-binding domain-containing protein [Scytonema sp. PMC 1069.18]MEC4881103.1 peptidoglycan-binding domain-containing protein [Scytonema sp. PMC 1070.18]